MFAASIGDASQTISILVPMPAVHNPAFQNRRFCACPVTACLFPVLRSSFDRLKEFDQPFRDRRKQFLPAMNDPDRPHQFYLLSPCWWRGPPMLRSAFLSLNEVKGRRSHRAGRSALTARNFHPRYIIVACGIFSSIHFPFFSSHLAMR